LLLRVEAGESAVAAAVEKKGAAVLEERSRRRWARCSTPAAAVAMATSKSVAGLRIRLTISDSAISLLLRAKQRYFLEAENGQFWFEKNWISAHENATDF